MKKDWKKRVEDLRKVHEAATTEPEAQTDAYMRGLANGVILALAIMEDKDPEYLRGKQ